MMLQTRERKTCGIVLLLFCCALLASCLGGGARNAVSYYLVDTVPGYSDDSNGEKQLAIELIDLHIPQYLQRFQLVTRDTENRLKFSDGNQWAENLRKNLLRTLAANLATRLSTIDIGTPLNRSATPPDYRIHIHILKFELDSGRRVQLAARWQLSGPDEESLGMHVASMESDSQIQSGDYDQIVADMQELFARLCDDIAASIRNLEMADNNDA